MGDCLFLFTFMQQLIHFHLGGKIQTRQALYIIPLSLALGRWDELYFNFGM